MEIFLIRISLTHLLVSACNCRFWLSSIEAVNTCNISNCAVLQLRLHVSSMTIPWMHVHGVFAQMRSGSWIFAAAVDTCIFLCRLKHQILCSRIQFAALATRFVIATKGDESTSAPSHSFILYFRLHSPAGQHSCQQINYPISSVLIHRSFFTASIAHIAAGNRRNACGPSHRKTFLPSSTKRAARQLVIKRCSTHDSSINNHINHIC